MHRTTLFRINTRQWGAKELAFPRLLIELYFFGINNNNSLRNLPAIPMQFTKTLRWICRIKLASESKTVDHPRSAKKKATRFPQERRVTNWFADVKTTARTYPRAIADLSKRKLRQNARQRIDGGERNLKKKWSSDRLGIP
ncbi:hypothetical protein MVEN_01967500 [Mycena venus]|uniref:Uncharacterized protein n=1 Tax=Mycena venus TaxID=2733690 RepID=A0A8H6XG67_9AGAR|nr:hypothetical protein MVEN_01967500 [Mycena venus]